MHLHDRILACSPSLSAQARLLTSRILALTQRITYNTRHFSGNYAVLVAILAVYGL